MNIPSLPKSSSKALSKSWNPTSTLQSFIDKMEVDELKSRSHSDPLRRSALDPFLEGKECNHSPNKCTLGVIPAQKDKPRRISLCDALGPNFVAKTKEEVDGEKSCSYASLLTKKRTNVCSICGATDTPSWRRSKDDNRSLLCNACGLRNRSVRKRHKSDKNSKPEGESSFLPLSPHSGVGSRAPSPVDYMIMPLSPLSPLITSPIALSNQQSLFSNNDPLSMLFWDDVNFNNV